MCGRLGRETFTNQLNVQGEGYEQPMKRLRERAGE